MSGCGKRISAYHNEWFICGKEYSGGVRLCDKCIHNQKVKVEKTALTLACEFIYGKFGTCPSDMCGFEYKGDCSKYCKSDINVLNCWKRYFLEKEDK